MIHSLEWNTYEAAKKERNKKEWEENKLTNERKNDGEKEVRVGYTARRK